MRRAEGRHVIVRAVAVCFLLVIAAGWIFFWRERQRQEELSFPADYYLCGGRNFYGAESELEEALQDLLILNEKGEVLRVFPDTRICQVIEEGIPWAREKHMGGTAADTRLILEDSSGRQGVYRLDEDCWELAPVYREITYERQRQRFVAEQENGAVDVMTCSGIHLSGREAVRMERGSYVWQTGDTGILIGTDRETGEQKILYGQTVILDVGSVPWLTVQDGSELYFLEDDGSFHMDSDTIFQQNPELAPPETPGIPAAFPEERARDTKERICLRVPGESGSGSQGIFWFDENGKRLEETKEETARVQEELEGAEASSRTFPGYEENNGAFLLYEDASVRILWREDAYYLENGSGEKQVRRSEEFREDTVPVKELETVEDICLPLAELLDAFGIYLEPLDLRAERDCPGLEELSGRYGNQSHTQFLELTAEENGVRIRDREGADIFCDWVFQVNRRSWLFVSQSRETGAYQTFYYSDADEMLYFCDEVGDLRYYAPMGEGTENTENNI